MDMTRRLFPASVAVVVAFIPLTVLMVSRIGPVFLVPYALAGVTVIWIGTILQSRPKPEYWLFGGDIVVLCAMAAAVVLTGGTASPALSIFPVAIVAGAARHTQRGLFVYSGATLVMYGLACLLALNRDLRYDDLRFVGFLTTTVAVAILVITITRAEREHREISLVDPLTGTLNRFALMRRLEELRAQAALGDSQLCVIAGDIDHFKAVNDTHGHPAGDMVLREVALALRSKLRSFPLLYRTGGEEFLAMLPGLSRDEGERIAERLRGAVAAARPGGIPVTMSFGVAASADPDTVVSVADRCLYRAKEAGRNRVVAHRDAPVPGFAAAAC